MAHAGQPSASDARQPSVSVSVSIVIPTRGRPSYLEIALQSIVPQARTANAEVLVVDDAGPSSAGRAQAERLGARYEPHERPLGLNVARNTGIERSHGELVVFVDDDIAASDGWLEALLNAAHAHPEVDVFAGAILARLGGSPPRSCGRESAPITTLDLGPRDTDAQWAWGSNMMIRRSALQRVGPFDVTLEHGGDEQEWQERLRAREPDTRVLYVAGASVDHRRSADDTRLTALMRAQYVRGAGARRFDARRSAAPPLGRELRTLAGCGWHVARRRCPLGLTMVAHSAGRVRQALRERGITAPDAGKPGDAVRGTACLEGTGDAAGTSDSLGRTGPGQDLGEEFLSGESGTVGGLDGATGPGQDLSEEFLSGESGTVGGLDGAMRTLCDEAIDAWETATARRLRLAIAARHAPATRRVLAIGVVRPEHSARAQRIRTELLRSRHDVELRTCPPGGLGKFENLNRLIEQMGGQVKQTGRSPGVLDRSPGLLDTYDWLLLIDDDVELPRGFIDRLLFLSERFALQLAQPAHRLDSHAAWRITRRRPGSVAHETRFVEIGPVTALARATFADLLPFPEVRMGWGLDAHWAALAREHAWRCGVIDAVPIGHRVAPAAGAYSRADAIAEARELLEHRPYLRAAELQRALTTHHSW